MVTIVLQDCCDDDERHATMRAGSIFEDAELFWRLRGDREDSARPRGCCGDHQGACYFYEHYSMSCAEMIILREAMVRVFAIMRGTGMVYEELLHSWRKGMRR